MYMYTYMYMYMYMYMSMGTATRAWGRPLVYVYGNGQCRHPCRCWRMATRNPSAHYLVRVNLNGNLNAGRWTQIMCAFFVGELALRGVAFGQYREPRMSTFGPIIAFWEREPQNLTCMTEARNLTGTISAFWEERYNRVEIALVVLQIVGLVIGSDVLVLLPPMARGRST